jgi:hypothetical protein
VISLSVDSSVARAPERLQLRSGAGARQIAWSPEPEPELGFEKVEPGVGAGVKGRSPEPEPELKIARVQHWLTAQIASKHIPIDSSRRAEHEYAIEKLRNNLRLGKRGCMKNRPEESKSTCAIKFRLMGSTCATSAATLEAHNFFVVWVAQLFISIFVLSSSRGVEWYEFRYDLSWDRLWGNYMKWKLGKIYTDDRFKLLNGF